MDEKILHYFLITDGWSVEEYSYTVRRIHFDFKGNINVDSRSGASLLVPSRADLRGNDDKKKTEEG